MSLIHWWPLNGDLKDYGVKNKTLINNNVSFSDAGKIGKAALFDSDADSLACNDGVNELHDLNIYSLCCWVFLSSTATNHSSSFLSSGNWNASENQICFGVYNYTENGYTKVLVPNTSEGWWAGVDLPSDKYIALNTWHHYAIVYDGSVTKCYLDGVYVGSYNGGGFSLTEVSYFYLGAATYYTGFTMKGKLNDFRIYDHALSAKEVKEISKGLVLHYNFEDGYIEGTTNLISQSTPITYTVRCSTYGNGVKIDWTDPNNQSDTYFMFNTPNMTEGVTYTLSFDCSGLLADSDTTWAVSNTYSPTRLHNGRNAITFTPNSSALQLFFDDWSRDTRLSHLTMTNFQLEAKDHATPFVNGTRSPGLVYDNSGYGYNGTQNGNLQILEDSPSGEKSAKFNSNIYVDIPTLPEFAEVSYAFWIKIPTATEAYRSIFNVKENPTGGLWLSLNTEGQGLWSYYASSPSYSGISGFISADTWIHCVFVFKDGYANWYKNGEYMGRDVYYPNLPKIPSNHYCLGDSYTGSSWDGTPFDGQVADFKIYATALSANDILAEYNRKASIDRNGNVFTSEFVEECENIVELANYAIEKQLPFTGYLGAGNAKKSTYDYNWPNPTQSGLGAYEQGNLLVTLTSEGVRIYSEPNRDGRAQEGSEWNTWGGLCISPMMNSNCLFTGHRYIISWHIKGQSSGAMDSVYWSNQIGWGQYPDANPTYNKIVVHGADFQGEMDCFIDFTINDEVWKTTGSDVHSGFEPNTTYLAYAALKIGYGYRETGPLGTDIYITNLSMIDVTSGEKYNITKDGIINTPQIITGVNDKAKIHSSGILDTTDIIEC